MKRFPIFFSPLVVVLGCAPEPPPLEGVRSSSQAIKGGYTEQDMPSVVGIAYGGYGECSGSLILPNLVLTARHCVSTTAQQVVCGSSNFGPLKPAGGFLITTKYQMSQDIADYHTVKKVIGLPDASDVCGLDQALLLLKENIDPSEAVPLMPRVDTPVLQDDEYYAVGYGATNDAGSGFGTRRRRDGLFVTCFQDECPPTLAKPTEWVGDVGICGGDSGGPALDLQDRVTGVVSRGGPNCSQPIYGAVLGWADWLKQHALEAATDGGYAAPPWVLGAPTDPTYYAPIGDACSDASTCPGGLCVTDAQGSYCSKPCTDLTSCGDGFECVPDGTCAVIPPLPPPPPDSGSSGDPNTQAGAGCSVGVAGVKEPSKPIPWLVGLAALLLARRRRLPRV